MNIQPVLNYEQFVIRSSKVAIILIQGIETLVTHQSRIPVGSDIVRLFLEVIYRFRDSHNLAL